jgi:hypothetical protein
VRGLHCTGGSLFCVCAWCTCMACHCVGRSVGFGLFCGYLGVRIASPTLYYMYSLTPTRSMHFTAATGVRFQVAGSSYSTVRVPFPYVPARTPPQTHTHTHTHARTPPVLSVLPGPGKAFIFGPTAGEYPFKSRNYSPKPLTPDLLQLWMLHARRCVYIM